MIELSILSNSHSPSDEIDADSCAVFILFDNQSEPFGPTLDVRWTVLVFDHRPGHMHLQFPSYCLKEFKEAGCISTVVALYLLRFCDENLTDDMKVAFFMLYGTREYDEIYRPSRLYTSEPLLIYSISFPRQKPSFMPRTT